MQKLLIVGAGDIAMRALPMLVKRFEVYALARDAMSAERLNLAGATAIVADLDVPDTLTPITGLAERIVHLAPPPTHGVIDLRTTHLLEALWGRLMVARTSQRSAKRLIYVSTSGVYGDCRGDWVDEGRSPNPQTERAMRRLDAEQRIATWCGEHDVSHAILRVPGIYAADRLPIARLAQRTPVLHDVDDVYTNHIHADDLATIVVQALDRDEATGIFNASDDSALKMGEYFDLVADRMALPRPPRIAREEAAAQLPPALLSFMSESRRLVNRRMKDVLGIELRYPTVYDGIPIKEINDASSAGRHH